MSVHYPETGHDWCAQLEDASFWFQHRNECFLHLMRAYPPDTPLYDVGGGNGAVAAALVRNGIKAIVVEPGEAGARRARERGLEVLNTTVERSGRLPGSLPSVGIFDVLEHIENSVAFLQSLHGLMRPGARIFVAVPAYRLLWSGEDDFAQHFRRYTRRSLVAELTTAGFDIEYTTYLFSFLTIPILLLRALPYRLGLARKPTAESARADHSGGPASGVLHFVRDLELMALRVLGRIPFGTSVVAIARKPTAAAN